MSNLRFHLTARWGSGQFPQIAPFLLLRNHCSVCICLLLPTTPFPRDVDILLIMQTDFKLEETPRECQTLFSHADADARFGASIFWLREGMVPQDVLQDVFDTWQTKRDGIKRGMVEVIR